MTWADIDAVVIGTAPDIFEGVMMPELYLADALGAAGQADHARAHRGQRRRLDRGRRRAPHRVAASTSACSRVAFEKQCEGDTNFAFSSGRSGGVGAGGYFAPHIRAYIERSGAPDYVGPMVAVKDRKNALKNPYAHLQIPDISIEMVMESPMRVGPDPPARVVPDVRRRVRDGAHQRSGRRSARRKPPAWVHGTAVRTELGWFPGRDPVNPQGGQDCAADVYRQAGITEPAQGLRRGRVLRAVQLVRADVDGEPAVRTELCRFPGRDPVNPQGGQDSAADVYKQAGITNPREEFDVAEIYVPFSWYEPMWLENLGFAELGEGWKMTESGATVDGRRPARSTARAACSRRTRSARRACCASPRPRCRCAASPASTRSTARARALGHAYGGAAQYFSMWVVGSEMP